MTTEPQNERVDTANEPVDTQDDEGFVDTGVLHEDKSKRAPQEDDDE